MEYYWATDKLLYVDGERMTPEEAYKNYPDHKEELEQFVKEHPSRPTIIDYDEERSWGYHETDRDLNETKPSIKTRLKLKLMDFKIRTTQALRDMLQKPAKSIDGVVYDEEPDIVTDKQIIKHDGLQQIAVAKQEPSISTEESLKLKAFCDIYSKLANELTFDEGYAKVEKRKDAEKGLTAYQVRSADIERTKVDKRGVCTTFSFRLNDELNKLGIENYILIVQRPDSIHFCNLYKIGGQWLVADLTKDIVYGNMFFEKGNIPTVCSKMSLDSYIETEEKCEFFVMPYEIQDDNKKMNEIKIMKLSNFIEQKQVLSSEQYQYDK